jgi:hypothetical protein
MEQQREMNFFELCVAFVKAIGRLCKVLWRIFSQMIRHTFQYWWIVFPCLIVATGVGFYFSRYENLNYRVNAVAMLNGPTITQFQQAFNPLSSGQNIPAGEKIAEYIYTGKTVGFSTYRVVDCLNDGVADYIDFKSKSSPTDTTRVQMQDRICLQFTIKSIHLGLLPEIEEAVLHFLNSNPALQKSYEAYLPNLRDEVSFNHTQAIKLDSLTSQYYFNNNFDGKNMANASNGVAFVGDREVKLFLDEIYEHQAHLQRADYRMQLATAPVVLENSFSADPTPTNPRAKCLMKSFLVGWVIGCLLAELIKKRKTIFAWLKQ